MPKISALPPAGTLADDDETPFVDDSVSTTKKFTLAGLLTWLESKTSWVSAAMIAGINKSLLTTDVNPYKFSAWKSGAQTVNTGAAAKVTFATEEFDSNNNFASSTYTVPVAGFYLINAALGTNAAASATRRVPDIYVNGAQRKRGADFSVNATTGGTVATALLSLAANDTVEIYLTTVGANQAVTVDQATSYFQGYLISRT